MDDKLQPFRQPIVTATGLLLGFILNFASTFVKSDSSLNTVAAYAVGVGLLTGIVCLILVLYRILRINYPKDQAEKYYQITLRLFIFGVSSSFAGVMLDMFINFMLE